MRAETQTAVRALILADPPRNERERLELAESLGVAHPSVTTSRLLRPQQVMERLGISRRTLTNYKNRGLLRAVVPHGNRRALGYSEVDIETFISGVTSTPPASDGSKGGAA